MLGRSSNDRNESYQPPNTYILIGYHSIDTIMSTYNIENIYCEFVLPCEQLNRVHPIWQFPLQLPSTCSHEPPSSQWQTYAHSSPNVPEPHSK